MTRFSDAQPGKMSGTKHAEMRVMKRREAEAKTSALQRRLTENNILAGHGVSAARVEDKRRSREEALHRGELFMDFQVMKAEQDKARRTQIAQFEEHLADELARRKAEGHREDMDKKRICDGSEELRQLKERLHMAKVNKERAQQLLEIEVRKERDRVVDHHIAEHMENERLQHLELEHKLNIEKAGQRERVKTINQQQIAMKEQARQEAMQEYMKEKDQVAELVEKIAAEDAAEHKARSEKQHETQAILRKFMIEQKATQAQMEQQEIDENNRIEQYAADKRAREERLAAEKEEAEREKTRLMNKMIGGMMAKSKEKEELEHLRNELHGEELEAAARRVEEMKMRKKMEDKEEMKNAYVFQMRAKEEKAAIARTEEDSIRAELMAKFAEDDRVEQMAEHKRRMKLLEHKREAERLVALRRDMYDKQREDERQAEVMLREDEGKRSVVIEAERKRLLEEHARELKDFLPKGTLDNQEDYDFVFKGNQNNGGYPR